MQFKLVGSNDGRSLTAMIDGELYVAGDHTHPNFDEIVAAVQNDSVTPEMFDIGVAIATRFESLSERVTVANGHVFFDGDEVNNVLTDQILRVMSEGGDFASLVNFFENIATNPDADSRERLYVWLDAEDFTITSDGMIVGYKSVNSVPGEDGARYRSCHAGNEPVSVNGEVQTGYITVNLGDEVVMPRSLVTHDPGNACSVGLHVGTHRYADTFSGDTVLLVEVNPRDVVSVPDHDAHKMRVCRYVAREVMERKITESVFDAWDNDPTDYPFESEYCSNCDYLKENCYCTDDTDENDDTWCEVCREYH